MVEQRAGEAQPDADVLCRADHLQGLVDHAGRIEGIVAVDGRGDTGFCEASEGDEGFEIGIGAGPQPHGRDPGFQRVVAAAEIERADAVTVVMSIDRHRQKQLAAGKRNGGRWSGKGGLCRIATQGFLMARMLQETLVLV
ncbi:hypothetical protein LZK73_14950 [Neorhizobium galegae]|nr:hypothetical protein LZK73_14950 [Neorhizobium galegae]